MKRNIKFKGKDVKGNWHYGFLTYLKTDLNNVTPAGCYISNNGGMPFAYEIRPETAGQSTDMYDKDGIEIFEGDGAEYYVSEQHSKPFIGIVKYDNSIGGWKLEDKRAIFESSFHEIHFDRFKIIQEAITE